MEPLTFSAVRPISISGSTEISSATSVTGRPIAGRTIRAAKVAPPPTPATPAERTRRARVANGVVQPEDGPATLTVPVDWGSYELVVTGSDGAESSLRFDAGWGVAATGTDVVNTCSTGPAHPAAQRTATRIATARRTSEIVADPAAARG